MPRFHRQRQRAQERRGAERLAKPHDPQLRHRVRHLQRMRVTPNRRARSQADTSESAIISAA